ncbi:MAG: undecaprenyl-diphosphate phosphatase [Lachnospiraceae bacterium]|nr:undecaprenyl-diphosphate phosphatase [Lachnospiraceae bacterium]
MIEILKAILFGIVEGVTEWLPVSSTGHMIILDEFVKLNVSEEFYKLFEVVIQLGAILAVILIFWDKLWPFTMRRKKIEGVTAIRETPGWKDGALSLWIKIVVACIPAAVVGIGLDDKIDELFYHPIPVALALIIVGILFIVIESTISGKRTPVITELEQLSMKSVIIIGLAQTLAAVFPGTSRSGATILAALCIGVSREVAAEFTFFLAVPVMAGASLLKLIKFLAQGASMTGQEAVILVVGCVVAFAVSMFVIRFLMGYIKEHDFKPFGWYRIVLGVLVIALVR